MSPRSVLAGFAPALTPPGGAPTVRVSTPSLRPAAAGQARGSTPPGDPAELRTPTDPEIETYLELEAELPPAAGEGAADADLLPAIGLGGEVPGEPASRSSTAEEGARVIETVTEDDSQTITLTVTESSTAAPPRRRTITSQGGGAVAGTIDDSSGPLRRAKRQSEGYDD